MYYLRHMKTRTRTPGKDDLAPWQHVETSFFLFWNYRNRTPNVLLSETREAAKAYIQSLNPDADFFR